MKMSLEEWKQEREDDLVFQPTGKRYGNNVRPTAKTLLSGVPGLTIQEVKFADEYSINPNGKQSALQAGYSESHAAKMACQLLKKKAIRLRIKQNLQLARASTIMEVRERKERLTQIGRADLRDFVSIQGNQVCMKIKGKKRKGTLRSLAIEETFDAKGNRKVTHKIQLHDPMKAIDMLNRMDGEYNETIDVSGSLVVINGDDANL
jgi:phage terminase small subunit